MRWRGKGDGEGDMLSDSRNCETGTEVITDPECSGCVTEWLQRIGMVTMLGKIGIYLSGLSSQIDSIDCLEIKIIYLFLCI